MLQFLGIKQYNTFNAFNYTKINVSDDFKDRMHQRQLSSNYLNPRIICGLKADFYADYSTFLILFQWEIPLKLNAFSKMEEFVDSISDMRVY